MAHPLKCPKCGDYRYIEFKGVRFENETKTKGFGVLMPFFQCRTCGRHETILPEQQYMKFKDDMLPVMNDGEFMDMPLKYIFSKIDVERKFKAFDHLGFDYDSRDYYLIPGLYREWDDGYLTPVFFDKDLLLYYNNHPDYSVKLTSFSSGNIYYKGKPMFNWGFGINRNGRIFKWLGDLSEDFESDEMKAHLKRFQASNISSDHDIVSKFYLSQNPFSPSDAFQTSDNESRLFSLQNDWNNEVKEQFSVEMTKVDIEHLSEYYKSPILEEREQIFQAYLSLNKYFVENLQEGHLRELLLKHGLEKKDLEKDGRKLGTLKLLTLFMQHVLKLPDSDKKITPLFVLNDLRQLHGHLSDAGFKDRYNFCKSRLDLKEDASDLEVFKTLVSKMIVLYSSLIKKKDE